MVESNGGWYGFGLRGIGWVEVAIAKVERFAGDRWSAPRREANVRGRVRSICAGYDS